jgi:hypothetical protein
VSDIAPRAAVRLPSIASLTDAAALSGVLGCEVTEVRVESLSGIGFSSAALTRVEVRDASRESHRLVLKRTRPADDWLAARTGDTRGREAQLLLEPSLAGVWSVFRSPYLACAVDAGEVGLLMTDVGDGLLPDVREPLSAAQEHRLLDALARLHARYWDADLSEVEWLIRPAHWCDLLAPVPEGDQVRAPLPPLLRDAVPHGWDVALNRLPAATAADMTRAGSEWQDLWRGLPHALVHGDAKVANFAIVGGDVAAFDWALAGAAPCAVDVGWYLAVNASRLTAAKEQVLAAYRALLERARGVALPDPLWAQLEDVAVVTGARALLWSKALALESGRAGAAAEWDWWVARLSAIRLR